MTQQTQNRAADGFGSLFQMLPGMGGAAGAMGNLANMDFSDIGSFASGLSTLMNDILGQLPIIGPLFSMMFNMSTQPPAEIVAQFSKFVEAAKVTAEGNPNGMDALVDDWKAQGKIAFADPQQEADFRKELNDGMKGALEDGAITPEELTALQGSLAQMSWDGENATIDTMDRLKPNEIGHFDRYDTDYGAAISAAKAGIDPSHSFMTYKIDPETGALEEAGYTTLGDLDDAKMLGSNIEVQITYGEGDDPIAYYISDGAGAGVYAAIGGTGNEIPFEFGNLTPGNQAAMQQPEQAQKPKYNDPNLNVAIERDLEAPEAPLGPVPAGMS